MRQASNNGTPDVRSRGIVRAGCYVDVVLQFPPTLTIDDLSAPRRAGAHAGAYILHADYSTNGCFASVAWASAIAARPVV
jgi:hypothetical protein